MTRNPNGLAPICQLQKGPQLSAAVSHRTQHRALCLAQHELRIC